MRTASRKPRPLPAELSRRLAELGYVEVDGVWRHPIYPQARVRLAPSQMAGEGHIVLAEWTGQALVRCDVDILYAHLERQLERFSRGEQQ